MAVPFILTILMGYMIIENEQSIGNPDSIEGKTLPTRKGIRSGVEVRKREEAIFAWYLEDLGLQEDSLRGKRILDVGAGNRNFAGYCIRTGLAEEVFSAEPFPVVTNDPDRGTYINEVLTPAQRDRLEQQTAMVGWSQLTFPQESFDFILSRKALPSESDIDAVFKALPQLRVGGEMRLFPFFLEDHYDPRRQLWIEAMNKGLDEIRARGEFDVIIEKVREEPKGLLPDGTPETTARIIIRRLSKD